VGVILTEHQREEMEKIVQAGLDGKKDLSLTGRAGTGKTTILDELGIYAVREGPWREVIYWTTTGRAKFILSKKVNAEVRTTHSGLYGRGDDELTEQLDHEGNVLLDEEGNPKMMRTGKIVFGSPRSNLPENALIVIDEASMMPVEPVYQDLMTVLPWSSAVLKCGDPNQLPPVQGVPVPGFREGDTPTAHLEEIHRQAWDNPVIRIADGVSKQKSLSDIFESTDVTHRFHMDVFDAAEWMVWSTMDEKKDSTLLTSTHQTRRTANNHVRKLLEHDDLLVKNDLLVALINDHERGLMNGETFRIVDIMDFESPFGRTFIAWREFDTMPMLIQAGTIGAENVRWAGFKDQLYARYQRWQVEGLDDLKKLSGILDAAGHPFAALEVLKPTPEGRAAGRTELTHSEANKRIRGLYSWIDYGYCLTIHKAQGSEWESVGYIRDWWVAKKAKPKLRSQLDYTAITRTSGDLFMWG
jgi:hypothetical protein